MKRKLLMAALVVAGALGFNANAQEDVTNDYLKNADLSTIDSGWDYFSDSFKYTDWQNDGDVSSVEFYSTWTATPESMSRKDFKFSQKVTLPAGDYRIAVNALYRNGRGDGTNPHRAWIFAGEQYQDVVAMEDGSVINNYTGSNDLHKAANAFSLGDFSNAFDFSVDVEGEIEVGFQGYFDLTVSWCALGPVKLYKYSLDDYIKDYEAKVPEAEALYNSPMNAQVLINLKDAASVDVKSFQTSAPITEAIKTLTDLIETAKKSIAVYATVKAQLDIADELDENGKAAYINSDAYTLLSEAYGDGSLEEFSAEQETALAEALREAAKQQTTIGANMTWAIENWDFLNCSSRKFPGWTIGETTTADGSVAPKDGTTVEYWTDQATRSFDYYQELTGLPIGKYTITASMWYSYNGVSGDSADGSAGVYGVSGDVEVYQGVDTETEYPNFITKTTEEIAVYDGTLRIGVKNKGTMGARWFGVDWIKLTLKDYITVPVEFSNEAGYATFSSEYALDLANVEGGKAYIVTSKAEEGTIAITECTETVPAKTGIIVIKDGEDDVTIRVASNAEELKETNYLVATDGENPVPEGSYVLASDKEGNDVGFYILNAATTVQAGKAYLDADAVSTANPAKVLRIVFGDETATAIEAVATEAEAEGALYNVAGQQVGKDYKGIVIKNGKKYLNK